MNVSDRGRQSKKYRANQLNLERLINDKSIDEFVETVFPKKNESKDLVNETGDRDLAVVIRQNVRKRKSKVRMVRMLPSI